MRQYDTFLTTIRQVLDDLAQPHWRQTLALVAARLVRPEVQTLWILGMGKNSHLARGAVDLLNTVGIVARWAPVPDLLHGVLGVYGPHDAALLLSKSGATEELLTLIRVLPANGGRVVCTMTPESPLTRLADVVILLPEKPEGDSADVLPLMSCQTFHLFLMLLVMHLTALEQVTYQTVVQAHPAGTIGQHARYLTPDQVLYPRVKDNHAAPPCPFPTPQSRTL